MFNPNSPAQVSILLFGGEVQEEVQVPILNELGVQEVYKTGQKRGQVKTKKGIKTIKIRGLGLKPDRTWETKKKGIFQTNEKVLQTIANISQNMNECGVRYDDAIEIAKLMLQIREKEKLLGTYYIGTEKFIHEEDSCVHPSFQHVQTDTGRLSCNRPNMQNVPR